ncbi:hypothetical protein LTR66_013716, partial [Elasticomyces elasticus]
MELQPLDETSQNGKHKNSFQSARRSVGHQIGTEEDDRNESLPSPTTASVPLQKWNHPRRNVYRIFATFWAFVVMGMNDAAYG